MLFNRIEEELYKVRRDDETHPLSSFAAYPFELEGKEWPTVEHYYQATKFSNPEYAEKIRLAQTPEQAKKLGNTRWKRKRKDWEKIRTTAMTRATYIKCRTYPDIAKTLTDTGDIKILEVSLYDYFWGCGRDLRGTNAFGEMLMDIRKKWSCPDRAQRGGTPLQAP